MKSGFVLTRAQFLKVRPDLLDLMDRSSDGILYSLDFSEQAVAVVKPMSKLSKVSGHGKRWPI